MRKIPNEESVYPMEETEDEKKQSYNNFERILFLLILFIISTLGLAISVTVYVLTQCYHASKSFIQSFRSSQYRWQIHAHRTLVNEQLRQSK